MRSKFAKLAQVATLCLALAFSLPCASNGSPSGSKNTATITIDKRAVGTWKEKKGRTWIFNSDGTGIANSFDDKGTGGNDFEYTFFSDKIVINIGSSIFVIDYVFSADGKTFIIYGGGSTMSSSWLTKKE